MVYLLHMVIFHGYVKYCNQMVRLYKIYDICYNLFH